MNKSIFIALIAAIIILGAGGYLYLTSTGGKGASTNPQSGTPTTTGQVVENSIEIGGFKFNPDTITVKPGAVITVTNRDIVGHTVTSDNEAFDTGLIGRDESKTITAPTTPGEYSYHCTPHPFMKGKIIVQ